MEGHENEKVDPFLKKYIHEIQCIYIFVIETKKNNPTVYFVE